MTAKNISIFLLATMLLTFLCGCTSMTPKARTLILSEPAPDTSFEKNADTTPSIGNFEILRIHKLSLDKLDPNGIHPKLSNAVKGWFDNENLVAMSLQRDENGKSLTRFVCLHSQYGFIDPILTLEDTAAECFDLSKDREYAACVVGNVLYRYRLNSGEKISLSRQVLASYVTFDDQNRLYFTSAGDQKQLERQIGATDECEVLLSGISYRALAAKGESRIIGVVEKNSERIGFEQQGEYCEDLLKGKVSGSSCILPDGNGLLVYGSDLYLLTGNNAQKAGENITAFDMAPDEMHIAISTVNDQNGTGDIRIGYWGGKGVINDRLIYKDIGLSVDEMFFSPDMKRLYVQGINENGAWIAYVFEFE